MPISLRYWPTESLMSSPDLRADARPAMLSLGERIANELGRGSLEQVYIKGEKGYVILMSVGEEAVLTALAREQAKLGLIFLDMRRATEDLNKLI